MRRDEETQRRRDEVSFSRDPRPGAERRAGRVISAIVLFLAAIPALAVEPATLIGPRLQQQQVRLVGISEGTIRYFGADRTLQSAATDDFVALRFDRPEPERPAPKTAEADDGVRVDPDGAVVIDGNKVDIPGLNVGGQIRVKGNVNIVINGRRVNLPQLIKKKAARQAAEVEAPARAEDDDDALPIGVLLLADGQRVVGRLATAGDAGVTWQHNRLGDLTAPLDQITEIRIGDADPTPLPLTGSDVIVLANGDRLTGWVAAVNDTRITLDLGEDQTIDLPWTRVARLRLTNPVSWSPGTWLELVDGSRVLAGGMHFGAESAGGMIFGERRELAPTEVRAIEFAEKYRLVPLAELPLTVTGGGQAFGVDLPVEIEGRGVFMHGPLVARVELPERTERLAGRIALVQPESPWADLELTVRDDSRTRTQGHLHAEHPAVDFNFAPAGRELVFDLAPAANGPVHDRVVLRDAVVLTLVE